MKKILTILAAVFALSANAQIITTVAGNGTNGFSGDNGQATLAKLNNPVAVTVDADGNLYIADSQNQRIRRVNASAGVITTIAGNGTASYSGDSGQAVSAGVSPNDIAFDAQGNIYIADGGNARVRKVDASTGIITTIAGLPLLHETNHLECKYFF